MDRVGVIGAGIVGLAVARRLALDGAEVTVIDKEPRVGAHQTGHNSGVVHVGLYYKPGSLKARLCRDGASMLRGYCAEHAISYREPGKLVVAVTPDEVPRLDEIEVRARANGVPDLARLDAAGLREIEPHATGVAALHSPRTAVVDFAAVAERYAADVREAGGRVLLSHPVRGIAETASEVEVVTRTAEGAPDTRTGASGGARRPGAPEERLTFDHLIVCAGLGTDRLARAAGLGPDPRIVPFRGEYHRLRGAARDLVRGLIYPVPDPRYPFLGVHLTRHHDDEVLVGPNAILALALEGYRWHDVSAAEMARVLAYPGFRRMARAHWRAGAHELRGSVSRRAFAAAVRRYVPEITPRDLERAPAGVRAQAVGRDGSLLDDFAIDNEGRITIVRNAPSPAATSSLAIAEHICARLRRS